MNVFYYTDMSNPEVVLSQVQHVLISRSDGRQPLRPEGNRNIPPLTCQPFCSYKVIHKSGSTPLFWFPFIHQSEQGFLCVHLQSSFGLLRFSCRIISTNVHISYRVMSSWLTPIIMVSWGGIGYAISIYFFNSYNFTSSISGCTIALI